VRISLGDVSLWFDVSGPSVVLRGDTAVERPVLVAVHGGPGLDHTSVKSALAPLADDFQILYVDLRGHGRSDHSSAGFWNLRTWADDLRRLCDALGLDTPPEGTGTHSASSRHSAGSAATRQPPPSSAASRRRPKRLTLSSGASATRSTAARPAGPRKLAGGGPGRSSAGMSASTTPMSACVSIPGAWPVPSGAPCWFWPARTTPSARCPWSRN
jgi:pimeloyl-ACP methyl ester carboxylesterase